MARPTTKADLVLSATDKFKNLWELIDSMPIKMQKAPFEWGDLSGKKEAFWKRDKNIRDVLIHLYEWHQLLLNWVEKNEAGETTPFLPPPYNWRNYGQMNVEFWEKHQKTSYEDAQKMVKESHKKVMVLIESFTNEELFSKGVYSWTGGSTLGSYCVSATASHYDWAMKVIRAHKKIQTEKTNKNKAK